MAEVGGKEEVALGEAESKVEEYLKVISEVRKLVGMSGEEYREMKKRAKSQLFNDYDPEHPLLQTTEDRLRFLAMEMAHRGVNHYFKSGIDVPFMTGEGEDAVAIGIFDRYREAKERYQAKQK